MIGLGVWAYKQGNTSTNSASNSETNVSTTTSYTVSTSTDGIKISGGSATVRETTSPVPPTAPNYKKPIVYSSDVAANVRTALNADFAKVQEEIAANPKNFDAWVALGGLYKMGGDYMDAATVWEYVSAQWPGNQVSFNNLGDLYMNFLHEYPKAAANYQQEIKNFPTDVQVYEDLYTLYTGPYPQPSSVITSMLQKGIAANPDSADLKATLSAYQASQAK